MESMQWWVYGLFYGLLIAIGFAGRFYFSNALQKQITVLLGAAVVVGFLTWIGSGADLVGLLREWYKERRKKKRFQNWCSLENLLEPNHHIKRVRHDIIKRGITLESRNLVEKGLQMIVRAF